MKHKIIKTINTIVLLLIAANFTSAQTNQLPTPDLANVKSLQEDTMKWQTTGFKQANTMGGGEAPISDTGKFRVFVLMGQSNMQGAGRANELEAPYNENHERIRIWANGRWEYFVPSMRFGPGVSFAHQLAEFWPDDNIGIIKVASGGTGICGFEKDWSYERAQLTFDGDKGPLYEDLMNAVAEAKLISEPEFCGFFWKQGAADGTKKILANAYYDRFKQLISDQQVDLGVPDLPTFVPVYANDKDLLNFLLANMNEEDLLKAKNAASKPPENDEELLKAILSYINDQSLSEAKRLGGSRPYHATVMHAQNRSGREIPGVTALYPGRLPIGADGTHYSSDGYITLGKITASAVEEFYMGIDKTHLEAAIQQAQIEVNAQAENIGDQLGQYSQAIFDAATNAIAVAREALGNDLTKSGLDYALNTLAVQMEQFVPFIIYKAPLDSAIQQAQVVVSAQTENIGDKQGQYTQATFDAATNAIAAAQQVLDAAKQQNQIDEALATLEDNMASFVPNARDVPEFAALQDALDSAREKVDSAKVGNGTGEYSQDVFNIAINSIIDVQNVLDTATVQSVIDAWILTLDAEMAKFLPNVTGIHNAEFTDLRIYPNPVSDMLFVSADNLVGIKIIDLSGRVLIQKETESNRINVSALQNGIYFIQIVKNDNSVGTGRFVKRKH
ncbi:MAG TPA: T9SS type A sorting domain-containing protein [Bacteroides sp.]|nr:T9SS type A sorting domain-containing protein [Bacteroides sp.]